MKQKTYEYIIWDGKPMDLTLKDFLNQRGLEGWHLVHYGHTFIFMREIL